MTEDCEIEQEEVMDRILFIIKDKLPKNVVNTLYEFTQKIKGKKNVIDMKAYLLIEFCTKIDAGAAKCFGFHFTHNNVPHKVDYIGADDLALYMTSICGTIGNGY